MVVQRGSSSAIAVLIIPYFRMTLLYFTLLREVHWRSLGAVPRRQNGELLAYTFCPFEHDLTMMSISSASTSYIMNTSRPLRSLSLRMQAKETNSQESASAGDMFHLPSQATEDPSATETPLVSDNAPLALKPRSIRHGEH